VVLGDWIDRFTYAVLEDGAVKLKTWGVAAGPAGQGSSL